MIEAAHSSKVTNPINLIGGIPVRNLWVLMLYASDLYRHLDSAKIAVEENPEGIADLVAEILCHQVEVRLMRNLSYGYRNREDVVSRVRGKINLLTTERKQLLSRGKICCRFDELTIDTARNRYVKSALETISTLVTSAALAHRSRSLSSGLGRLGVSSTKPIGYNGASERLGRNDAGDQKMISAADLAFTLDLPTEFTGSKHLVTPDDNITWIRKLFEKGVAGLYAVAFRRSPWRVSAGKQLKWQIDSVSEGAKAILPSMKTDIMLENVNESHRIIIDTKFNKITTSGWYREETLRSGYIYQMYAYLRSQEECSDPLSLNATGMLLHPTVDKDVDEFVTIQKHKIRFCTINLSKPASEIKAQLLSLILN